MTKARVGIDLEYYSSYDRRLDLLIEAGVEAVAHFIAREAKLIGFELLKLQPRPEPNLVRSEQAPLNVFRLPSQSWSQVFTTYTLKSPMMLAQTLARTLETRVVHIELTDDCWGGYILFDRGEVVEISWLCVNDDLLRFGPKLPLDIPSIEEDERYDEVEYFHSALRPNNVEGDLESLINHLGAWLDSGTALERPDTEQVGLVTSG